MRLQQCSTVVTADETTATISGIVDDPAFLDSTTTWPADEDATAMLNGIVIPGTATLTDVALTATAAGGRHIDYPDGD